ncbi:MAG: protoheme IX farnesyltransferase, partial [Anaerolineae bacterium]|nr:protoheme IX farnesyltransferase [Anaerolineae bacterium]
ATVLFKLRVVGLVTFTALVSMAVAEQGAIHPLRMAHLALAGTLAAAGAAALNHYLDRDLDAIMDRTQRRPLP